MRNVKWQVDEKLRLNAPKLCGCSIPVRGVSEGKVERLFRFSGEKKLVESRPVPGRTFPAPEVMGTHLLIQTNLGQPLAFECGFHKDNDLCLFCSRFCSQCLAHGRCWRTVCWMNEWFSRVDWSMGWDKGVDLMVFKFTSSSETLWVFELYKGP